MELLLIVAIDKTSTRPVVSRPLRNSSNPNNYHHAQPYLPILPINSKMVVSGGKAGFSIMFVHFGRKCFHDALGGNALARENCKWIEISLGSRTSCASATTSSR